MSLRVIRARDCPRVPWKNGGGTTVEIAVSPEGAGFAGFDWRISSALVERAGPFSALPGIDRTLCVISPGALDLVVDGTSVRLDRHSPPFTFSGDAAVTGAPLGGPVHDLNVMTRRGRASHAVAWLDIAGPTTLAPKPGTLALFVVAGGVSWRADGESVALEAGDTALGADRPLEVAPSGAAARLLAIRVSAGPESAFALSVIAR